MKKQFLALAAFVLVLAACHNQGSSTVAEQDDEYAKTFQHGDGDSSHTSGEKSGH